MKNGNKVIVYRLSLWIGIPTALIGFYLHRIDYIFADFIIAPGAISALVILILGLIDVLSNNKIKKSEKLMWVCGFIFITFITGLLYFRTFKKRNFIKKACTIV